MLGTENFSSISECKVGSGSLNMSCMLSIHYEDGLSLERTGRPRSQDGDGRLWSHAFEEIEKSADDNKRFLYIKFKGEDIPRVSC